MNINKLKFPIHSQKNKTLHQKTQQFSPYAKNSQRRLSQKGKDLLIPIQKLTHRQGFNKDGFRINKVLKSEGRSVQKQQNQHVNNLMNTKMQPVDIYSLKNSLILKKQRQSLELVAISKKKPSTNRIVTQKLKTKEYDSADRNHQAEFENNFVSSSNKSSYRKILPKNQIARQNLSKNLNMNNNPNLNKNVIRLGDKFNQRKITILESTPQKYPSTQIRKSSTTKRSSSDKKLTPYEKEQISNYEVHYSGNRRIYNSSDFTDQQGEPKINIGDAIAYKYEITENLGRGSFGKVYKAYDHKKKQFVALKIIKAQQKFTNQAKIQVEILQTALLHDPKLRCNLVRMKNSFNFRGHACITFEILHKNLYEFLKQTNFAGFSLDLIRRFSIQILQTLLFFCHFKIIHCDLKPENILLKQQNKSGIKVIDVGSGCFQPKQLYTYIQSRFYRAPQIILGIKYTNAIDVWSMGCILVELYTGFPLFPGENQNQQMLMFMEILGPPPYSMLQISERKRKFFDQSFQCKIPQQKGKQRIQGSLTFEQILGQCDADFVDLVSKCLQWDPKKRISAKQALLHKWIVNGLPTSIRNQHIEQITNFTVR